MCTLEQVVIAYRDFVVKHYRKIMDSASHIKVYCDYSVGAYCLKCQTNNIFSNPFIYLFIEVLYRTLGPVACFKINCVARKKKTSMIALNLQPSDFTLEECLKESTMQSGCFCIFSEHTSILTCIKRINSIKLKCVYVTSTYSLHRTYIGQCFIQLHKQI